ncbi:MAG TPA: DJ-1/PfpI family protein, partial [Candidatus Marinimicrobia bacterium]|nr:DJ-1/PfpI family protein [Candidatus Neomarinimicrobiota bacterium]HIO74184.1 DJ-1/PfpI family protein [Candidatus Neomarinimicrobiota bacterium]
MKPISVGIFIFNDVEVLDFTGPFEVFSTTRKQA